MIMLDMEVIKKDNDLENVAQLSGIELAGHRWHWTRDDSNAMRVTVAEYARAVGRSGGAVRFMVAAFASWKESNESYDTFADHLERAKLKVDDREATEAVAKARGVGLAVTRQKHAEEVREVKAAARERSERRGTPVADEIVAVAQDRAKAREADKRRDTERKAKRSIRYVEMEGKIAAAMRNLRYVLDSTEGVEFDDEERELLVDSLAKLRALLNLLDVRLTGATSVDWDAEMIKLGDAS